MHACVHSSSYKQTEKSIYNRNCARFFACELCMSVKEGGVTLWLGWICVIFSIKFFSTLNNSFLLCDFLYGWFAYDVIKNYLRSYTFYKAYTFIFSRVSSELSLHAKFWVDSKLLSRVRDVWRQNRDNKTACHAFVSLKSMLVCEFKCFSSNNFPKWDGQKFNVT